jgi:hypothetical protein
MSDVHTVLNDKQKKAVRSLQGQRAQETQNITTRHSVISQTGLSDQDYDHLLHYLVNQKAVDIFVADDGVYAADFAVEPGIHELVRELNNPPKEDHWKNLRTWFASKWWSVPIFVLVVGLPLIYTYFQMVKDLGQWLTTLFN